MRVIRFADLGRTPWKNGGGTTTEIATSPEGAGFDVFDWRLSIADVAGDGPFSLFPDIDRTLTVIEGNGLTMTIGGRTPVTLTPASGPLYFAGDVPVSAKLVDGPIRDFNVMTRRGRINHAVMRHDLGDGPAVLPADGIRLLLSLGTGSIAVGGEYVDAAFGDVIVVDGGAETAVEGSQAVLIVQLKA